MKIVSTQMKSRYKLVFDTNLFIPNNNFLILLHAHNPSFHVPELSPLLLYTLVISSERIKTRSDLMYNLPKVYLHCTRKDLTVWLLLSLLSLYHGDNFLKIRCRTFSAGETPKITSTVPLYLETVPI